jgi:hypothetical protein
MSWKSSKQETTTNSNTKIEYSSMFEGTKKVVWIKKFIIELGTVPNIVNLVALYCDNNRVIDQDK